MMEVFFNSPGTCYVRSNVIILKNTIVGFDWYPQETTRLDPYQRRSHSSGESQNEYYLSCRSKWLQRGLNTSLLDLPKME